MTAARRPNRLVVRAAGAAAIAAAGLAAATVPTSSASAHGTPQTDTAHAHGSANTHSSANAHVASQLAAVRAATARYHNVRVAIADGYLPSDECVASPDGGMGMHYVNPARMGSIDPLRPGILLYAKAGKGVRLVGVEYFKADADQNLGTDEDRPSLFGQAFDGPMPGHEPGMPVHFDLHVWLWAHNPAGTFAAFNPALSC